MTEGKERLAVALFSEMFMAEQLTRGRLSRALPDGMELSHFSVLNHLCHAGERTPAQLARSFHVTRGAMTNTITRLASAGYVHIRPDWDDARRKFVSVTPPGRQAREAALQAIVPILSDAVTDLDTERLKAALPVLRDIRVRLDPDSVNPEDDAPSSRS